MAKITIDKNKCKGCLLCINFCPKRLLVVDKNLNLKGVRPVRFSRQSGKNSECLGCMMCAIICPDCCIEVYK